MSAEVVPHGPGGSGGARTDVQLAQDAGDMPHDGVVADEELVADLAVSQSLGEQA